MKIGLGLSLCSFPAGAGVTVFDPGTLSLTGWWRASFTASPWVGEVSSRNISEATNPPAVGAALNGRTPASFDGVNDKLAGTDTSVFLSANAYSGWCLFNATSVATDVANGYGTNDCLLASDLSARFGLYLRSSSKVGFGHYNGATTAAVEVTCSIGSWCLAQFKWDKVAMKIRSNSGAWASSADTNSAQLAGAFPFTMGRSPNLQHFTGRVAEAGVSNVTLTDDNFDDIKSYINSRYALSL